MNSVFSNPRLNDSSLSYTTTFKQDSLQSYAQSSVSNYLSFIQSAHTLSKSFSFKPFFFIQPVPYFDYPNKKRDPKCDKTIFPQYNVIYPILKAEANTGKHENLYYIGDLLLSNPGNPFIDRFHYTPAMNKRIAAAIFQKIQPVLLQKK
jgi:hypothetical protein